MFEQDRVVVRLQQRVLQEQDIVACFLAGSYGRKQHDGYSDLDVGLVFRDESRREAAWQDRSHFARSVLPYISAKSFDAIHVRPYLHIALYANGAKVDFRYETQESLEPNPWDRDLQILKDQDGWCERFSASSAARSYPQPQISTAELEKIDSRFWVMFWDALRLLLRGDHDKPFTIYMELLHFSLPPLLGVLPREHAARQRLLIADFTKDTRRTARHLSELLQAYIDARSAVVERLNLAFSPDAQFESFIRGLVLRSIH